MGENKLEQRISGTACNQVNVLKNCRQKERTYCTTVDGETKCTYANDLFTGKNEELPLRDRALRFKANPGEF